MLSVDNKLIEASARNVFIVKDETLYSPQLDQCGVEGVMRQLIIDKIAPQLGLDCIISSLSLDDLLEADEVFLSNSISGIWPVVEFEEKSWSVGPVTRSLQAMCHGFLS